MTKYHTEVIQTDNSRGLQVAINDCIEESDYKLVPPIQFQVSFVGFVALLLFIK